MFEFHVSRQARDRYQFDQTLFRFDGNVIFANFHGARLFAQKMNQKRDLAAYPEQAVKAGQINAMGMVDEILHLVVSLYRRQKNPTAFSGALAWLEERLGTEQVNRMLVRFTAEFPPVVVYQQQMTVDAYLAGSTDGITHREAALEELLMLWISNKNPALAPYLELFDDSGLQSETVYARALKELHIYFETQPKHGPDNQNLIDMLRAPALANPYSLTDQLEFIRTRWTEMLGRYLYRLLSSLDLIKEENKQSFMGPGPTVIPTYQRPGSGLAEFEGEPERFSPDQDWMPRLVLIAKNTYVWLDQLSKQYGREMRHLDQIPDEELDRLAQQGFTGLWLIGLWERSRASAHIKQLCGNPEAIASAYSLFDYRIADDLGGELAYNNLSERAGQRGIRLASDMVPNHMAIDSPWVVEHPDWFVSLDYSPFPGYTFNGPDLSEDGRVSINIEDHYFDRTDAAVVFKRYDHTNGQTRFIYHGNDGTSMPWNDTAQLNYLNPAVREAVIQTILAVARRFPIIRFDAAMTLAKKHYQRLWYPEPGSGGDIPSRADHGMTRDQFNAAMPIEFWREVVDRVAQEVPNTLLLAEAFWLMEGYFVRTLGMHRVYNSAFMNMLRNEDNAGYRQLIKNTLEFDPEILKRYVNFMNNPDERTAADQFGKGDKYFGICTVMATLPGLPMFGHGQVEGFSEKYGMEFRRAYWDERIDDGLVERHRREIFPLLHRRWMFGEVANFLLYDFFTGGGVNEDVYAFSNGQGDERALVIFHNKYAQTSGWIRMSAAYVVKGTGDQRNLVQKSLAQGLNLHPAPNAYLVYRDLTRGMEYIRPSQEVAERGLYLELNAYETHVFADFREVQDDAYHSYRQLCQYLNGRGVPSVTEALRELVLMPVQQPFREIANPGYFNYLLDARLDLETEALPAGLLDEAEQKAGNLLDGIQYMSGYTQNRAEVQAGIRRAVQSTLSLRRLDTLFSLSTAAGFQKALDYLETGLVDNRRWRVLFGWAFTHNLGRVAGGTDPDAQTQSWLDEWQLGKMLNDNALAMGSDEGTARRMNQTLRLLLSHQNWYSQLGALPVEKIVREWLNAPEIQQFIGVNRYKDVLWFNHESFVELVWWMATAAVLKVAANPGGTAAELLEQTLGAYEIAQALLKAEENSGYQVDKLLALLSEAEEAAE